MKMTTWMMMFFLVGAVALAGCGKPAPPAPTVPVQQGVTIDLPKLKEAFATASPQLQASVAQAASLVAYKNYAPALAALAELAKASDLTDPQKDILSRVTAEVKEAASKAPPAPAP